MRSGNGTELGNTVPLPPLRAKIVRVPWLRDCSSGDVVRTQLDFVAKKRDLRRDLARPSSNAATGGT
jgi:hypothetical protein